MSKFCLSSFSLCNKLEERNEKSGYKKSGTISADNYYFTVYYKRNINDINFLRKGEDFISITGSLLYKDLRGEKLLEAVYEDYIRKGDNIRLNLKGNYAVIIKHGDTIFVFGEEVYFYDIFYYAKDGKFIVSNDLYDINTIEDSLDVDEHNLLEMVFLNGVIGNETVLKDVYRLSGDQKIVIDITNGNVDVQRMKVDWSRQTLDFEKSIKNLTDNLHEVAKSISNTYKQTAICMTGGLDSRMSYAALMSAGNKPTLYYGKGNSQVTNTHHQDFEICQLLSLKFGNKLVGMDWETSTPVDKDWPYYLEKYGLLFQTYAGSKNIMNSFEKIKEDFVTFGYLGEMFRSLPFTETHKKFTINEYIDEYYLPKNNAGAYIKKYCSDFGSFRQRLIKKYTAVCERYNLDPSIMKDEDFFYLNLEYRANADSLTLNLVNRMRYGILLLSPKSIISLANISVDNLKDSHYMLCILEKLYPECLNIPIFSHQKAMIYDKSNHKLQYKDKANLRHVLAKLIPTRIKQKLVSIFYGEKKNCDFVVSEKLLSDFIVYLNKNNDIQLTRWELPLLQILYALEKI